MPLVQPQNWPYNPWVFNKAEELWNKLPSDVRNNLKSISDAPTPGLPIGAADDIVAGGMKGAVAIPALLKNEKGAKFLKKILGGVDLGQEVKAYRQQQLTDKFPLSVTSSGEVPRDSLYFSFNRFHPDYANPEGYAEGGPFKVEWLQKLKNPLLIKRDNKGFLADQVIRQLLGDSQVDLLAQKPQNPWLNIKYAIQSVSNPTTGSTPGYPHDEALKILRQYISPKQIKTAVRSRSSEDSLAESIASSLARRAGYDSIISTRPVKTKEGIKLAPTQGMIIEKEFIKNMKQNYKNLINPPRSTLSSYGQSIVNLFKKGQMQSDALPDVLKFNLEQGTIAPEEIQLIQQAIQ